MDDQYGREALLLIGERTGLEPMVERWFSAVELGNVVRCGQQLGSREGQCSRFRDVAWLPGGRTLCNVHHFGNRGCRHRQYRQEFGKAFRAHADQPVLHQHGLGGSIGGFAYEVSA